MGRAKGRGASGFRSKLHNRAASLSLESLDMRRAKGRAASGFKPQLHSRAESLSLESLDKRSGKSRHESRQGSRRIRIFNQNCIVAPNN